MDSSRRRWTTTRHGPPHSETKGGSSSSTQSAGEPEVATAPDPESVVAAAEQLLRAPDPRPRRIVVIGGGAGGIAAALRAAQLGAEVTLVEKGRLGGAHLHWGTVPCKHLRKHALVTRLAAGAGRWLFPGCGLPEWAAIQSELSNQIHRLGKQLQSSLEGANVKVRHGVGRVQADGSVTSTDSTGSAETLTGSAVVVAVGSRPHRPPIAGADSPEVWTVDQVLFCEQLPEKLIIIGAGGSGVELAWMLTHLGVRCTLLEMQPQVMPLLDDDLGSELERALSQQGVIVRTRAAVSAIEPHGDEWRVTYERDGREQSVSTQRVLLTAGREARLEEVGLKEAGAEVGPLGVVVDETMRTTLPNVFAVGDVVRGVGTAYRAQVEAVVATDNAMGLEATMAGRLIPTCIHTWPEVASVGMIASASDVDEDTVVAVHRVQEDPVSLARGDGDTFVKLVIDRRSGEILGVHLLGPGAVEVIHEAVVAMTAGMRAAELATVVHAGPSLAWALAAAARKASRQTGFSA